MIQGACVLHYRFCSFQSTNWHHGVAVDDLYKYTRMFHLTKHWLHGWAGAIHAMACRKYQLPFAPFCYRRTSFNETYQWRKRNGAVVDHFKEIFVEIENLNVMRSHANIFIVLCWGLKVVSWNSQASVRLKSKARISFEKAFAKWDSIMNAKDALIFVLSIGTTPLFTLASGFFLKPGRYATNVVIADIAKIQ